MRKVSLIKLLPSASCSLWEMVGVRKMFRLYLFYRCSFKLLRKVLFSREEQKLKNSGIYKFSSYLPRLREGKLDHFPGLCKKS